MTEAPCFYSQRNNVMRSQMNSSGSL